VREWKAAKRGVVIQEDGVVHAYAFDTFMPISPPPRFHAPPTHYSHGTAAAAQQPPGGSG